jgi:hypothetical protein
MMLRCICRLMELPSRNPLIVALASITKLGGEIC